MNLLKKNVSFLTMLCILFIMGILIYSNTLNVEAKSSKLIKKSNETVTSATYNQSNNEQTVINTTYNVVIAVDEGHGLKPDTGAIGINGLVEDKLTKQVGDLVISGLQKSGIKVVSVRPNKISSVQDSLNQRCVVANKAGANLFVSIHFNVCNGAGHGTEVYACNDVGRKYAQGVVNEIAKLGFTNRGVKDGSRLAVVHGPNAPSILIECCFIDNKDDVAKFNAEAMANAILKGLGVEQLKTQGVNTTTTKAIAKTLKKGSTGNEVKALQTQLKKLGFNCGVTDGIFGNQTDAKVREFQKKYGLAVNGVVDQKMLEKLKSLQS